MRHEKRPRVPQQLLVVMLAFTLPGCLNASTPGAGTLEEPRDSAPPQASQLLTFSNVTWTPEVPTAGEEVRVTADVADDVLRDRYKCLVVITNDGSRGGGAIASRPLARQADGSYECVIPSGFPADVAFFVLMGRDDHQWVRTTYRFIEYADAPGEGRPPSRIGELVVTRDDPDHYPQARVRLQDPRTDSQPMNTFVEMHYWTLNRGTLVRGGGDGLLERVEQGVFEGNLTGARGEDVIVIGFASTTNSFDGHDHTAVSEWRFGKCAESRQCLVESEIQGS